MNRIPDVFLIIGLGLILLGIIGSLAKLLLGKPVRDYQYEPNFLTLPIISIVCIILGLIILIISYAATAQLPPS